MRKFLHLLLFFLALIPLRTYSQSAVIDNVTYLLDTSTHEATANAYNGTEETLDIPETIEYDGEAYTITTLGNLLCDNTIVKQLTLPITITKIICNANSASQWPFKNCALEEIDMSHLNISTIYSFDKFFYGCANLKSIKMPQTSKPIGSYMCQGCTALESITFSPETTSIGTYAFDGCTKLSEANINELTNLTSIGDYAFQNCTDLGDVDMSETKVKTLSTYVFQNCSALKTVKLPASLTTLGNYVFQNCTSLESIDMSETNVTEIPQYAFSECTALSTVGFPSALVSLGNSAFYNAGITTVELPATVKTIGANVFERCTSLTSADLSQTRITTITDYTFYNCSKLTSVLFSKYIIHISYSAFAGTALPSFTMPETVTTLGYNVFKDCTALKTVDFPNSKLNTIPNATFSGCTALTDIDFPKTITTLGTTIFKGCTALKTVDMSKTQLTSIPASTFSGLTALNTVKLPETVSTLGASCFANSGITAIVSGDNKAADGCVNLPSGLKTFPATAISGCTKLTTLDLGGLATAPKFSYTVLSSFKALTKFVFPKNSDLSVLTRKNSTTAYLPSTTAPLSVTLPSGESTPTIPNYFFYNINLGEVIFDEVPPTAIGNYAFANNPLCGVATEDGSTVFRIPDGVHTIGSNTFSGTAAKHLVADSICLSGTLTSIGSSAFTNNQCKVLVFETPVTPATAADMSHAPARVSSTPSLEIGSQAFSSTTGGPETVICHHSVPPTLPDNGFSMAQYSDGELVVGYRSANAYRTATGWKNFSDNLVTGIEEVGIDTDIDNENNLTRSDDDRTYNLMGMPVSTDRPLAPGIYIRNGKKIYIR
ncbi:MAG: leucine-rich repeat protein [Barnesiella sp.]|nr:leucine-rich repeat protein [Barnesiella sp.]